MGGISSLSAALSRSGLEGKVALITGGASRIGECTSKVFAHHGAKLVIADVQVDLGHLVYESLGQINFKYVHCNVTDESQFKNAVDKAVKTCRKLDIMFNNAGVADPKKARIFYNKKEDFERVLSVNVTGVFLGIKHASQAMIPVRSGSIICTARVCLTIAGASSHAYTCTRHAVVGLTRNVAVELGQFRIRVNCLPPYLLSTHVSRKYFGADEEEIEKVKNSPANLKRVTLKAEDVATAALCLASDMGRCVSGHNLLIDGGFTIVNPSFNVFQYPDDHQP